MTIFSKGLFFRNLVGFTDINIVVIYEPYIYKIDSVTIDILPISYYLTFLKVKKIF